MNICRRFHNTVSDFSVENFQKFLAPLFWRSKVLLQSRWLFFDRYVVDFWLTNHQWSTKSQLELGTSTQIRNWNTLHTNTHIIPFITLLLSSSSGSSTGTGDGLVEEGVEGEEAGTLPEASDFSIRSLSFVSSDTLKVSHFWTQSQQTNNKNKKN